MKRKTKFVMTLFCTLTTSCSLISLISFANQPTSLNLKRHFPTQMGNRAAKSSTEFSQAKTDPEVIAASKETAKILQNDQVRSFSFQPDVEINNTNNRITIKANPYYAVDRLDELLNDPYGTKLPATDWSKFISYSGAYQNFINGQLSQSEEPSPEGKVKQQQMPLTRPTSTDLVIESSVFGSPYRVVGVSHQGASASHIDVPEGVNEISMQAFQNCLSLKSITLPDTVSEIKEKAFLGCTNLESVVLSQRLQCLSKEIFSGCHSLKSVVLPPSVTVIDQAAFKDCTDLAWVVINGDVQSIAKGAFEKCPNLKKIYVFSTDAQQVVIDSFPKPKVIQEEGRVVNLNNFVTKKSRQTLYFFEDNDSKVDLNRLSFSLKEKDPYGTNFPDQELNYAYFSGFPTKNILQLLITNPEPKQEPSRLATKQTGNKVFVTSPTFQFAFTPIFNDLIKNIDQLPKQYQILSDDYQKSIDRVSKEHLKKVMNGILHHQVDYEKVQSFIYGIKDVNKVPDPTQLPYQMTFDQLADWYTNAHQTWQFTLNGINIENWHYFVQLASLRFSKDLFSELTHGDNVSSSSQKIWDANTYSFKPFVNDLGTSALNSQLATIKIIYPENQNVNNSQFVLDTSELEEKIASEVETKGIKLSFRNDSATRTITYTYPYNANPYGYAIENFVFDGKAHNVKFDLNGNEEKKKEIEYPLSSPLSLTIPFNISEKFDKGGVDSVSLVFDLTEFKVESPQATWIKQELFSKTPLATAFELVQKDFRSKLMNKLNAWIAQKYGWKQNCSFHALNDTLQISPQLSAGEMPTLSCQFVNCAAYDLNQLAGEWSLAIFNDEATSPKQLKEKMIGQINQIISSSVRWKVIETDWYIDGLAELEIRSGRYQVSITPRVKLSDFVLQGKKTINLQIKRYELVKAGQLKYHAIKAPPALYNFVHCQNRKDLYELAQNWLKNFDLSQIADIHLIQVDDDHFEVQVSLVEPYVFARDETKNTWTSDPVNYYQMYYSNRSARSSKYWARRLGLGLGLGLPLVLILALLAWYLPKYLKSKKQLKQD